MKYTYETVTGPMEIEVDEMWVNLLDAEDRRESNNNHTETRRHVSLNTNEGRFIVDPNNEIDEMFKGNVPSLREQLPFALNMLKESKPKQYELIKAIYFDGVKQEDYAKMHSVNQSSISRRLSTAKKSLKKFFEKTA